MRSIFLVGIIGLVASLNSQSPASSQEKGQWINLLGREMKDWSRTENGKSPWRLTREGGLICEKATESMIYDDALSDGVLRVEWRFIPNEVKKGHKAYLHVRGQEGGHGCRISLGEDCGSISAKFTSSSDREKVIDYAVKDKSKPVGEWNTIDVKLQGKSVAIIMEGKTIITFDNCPNEYGTLSLIAEGYPIEFRKVNWKPE